jgi:pimeloyl-ACP methyl ester carboxylesterase
VFQAHFADQGWETHALDLRGHGNTPNDRSLRRTRIKHYVEDVAAAVESLDRPPIVIAHSMGGLVVQRFLEDHTLPGAVLMAPVPLGGTTRASFRVLRRHPIAFLKVNLTWSLGPLVATERLAADMFLPDDADPADRAWVLERVQTESYLAYLDMLFLLRARPQLVHTPTRIIAAENDRIFGVKELHKLAGAYGTELSVVEGAAHDLMLGPGWERAAEAVEGALAEFE